MLNSDFSPYKKFISVNAGIKNASQPTINSPIQPSFNTGKPKEKKKGLTGLVYSIAGLTVLAAIGASFVLLRGSSGSLSGRLSRFVEKLDDKIANMEAKSKVVGGPIGFMRKIAIKSMTFARSIGKLAEKMTNFIPARDLACEKAMDTIGLGCVTKSITKTFKYFTNKAHYSIQRSSNAKVHNNLDEIINILEKLKKQHPEQAEVIETAKARLVGNEDSVQSLYQRTFAKSAFNSRLEKYEDDISSLPEKVQQKLKEKWLNNPYITDEETAVYRTTNREILNSSRRKISQSLDDIYNDVSHHIGEVRKNLNLNDEKTRELCRKFMAQMEIYQKSNPTADDVARLDSALENIKNHITLHYGKQRSKHLVFELDNIKKVYGDGNTKGTLQEIYTLIKNISGKNSQEAKDTRALIDKMSQTLDKNIRSEMRVYQKYGEMKVGSAFTDVGVFALAAGGGTYVMARSEGSDGHIESAFKQGVPLLSALGTLIYCTYRMVPNLPSLGISFVAGYICKLLGEKASDTYFSTRDKRITTKKALSLYHQQHTEKSQVAKTIPQENEKLLKELNII